jgi:hypothetical protein
MTRSYIFTSDQYRILAISFLLCLAMAGGVSALAGLGKLIALLLYTPFMAIPVSAAYYLFKMALKGIRS